MNISKKYESEAQCNPPPLYTDIKRTLPSYKSDKIMWFSKRDKENCRRPMFIDESTGIIDFKDNTSKNIADITIGFYDIHHKIAGVLFTSNEYISQKSSNLVTFINAGIRTNCFNPDHICSNNITMPMGKLLLKTLGLDQKAFCNTFNYYNEWESAPTERKEDKKKKMDDNALLYNKSLVNDHNSDDKEFIIQLENLIKKSMGVGNSIISHRIDNTDKIWKSKNIKFSIMTYKSYYGGKDGKAKRVNVEIKTEKMQFTFNIRNKSGDIYPTHLMCDFKYI